MRATIRAERPPDGRDVRRVVDAAFGAEGAGVCAILDDLASAGLLTASLVAEEDGELVGHVGLSRAWLDARARLLDVWVLSPLATTPERQGQGIGSALVAAALDTARAAGVPLVFLEGSPVFYGRLGFEPGAAHGFRPATVRVPVAAFQVAVLPGWDPADTGALVYPDVWWRHDAAGLRDPLLATLEQALGSWETG